MSHRKGGNCGIGDVPRIPTGDGINRDDPTDSIDLGEGRVLRVGHDSLLDNLCDAVVAAEMLSRKNPGIGDVPYKPMFPEVDQRSGDEPRAMHFKGP